MKKVPAVLGLFSFWPIDTRLRVLHNNPTLTHWSSIMTLKSLRSSKILAYGIGAGVLVAFAFIAFMTWLLFMFTAVASPGHELVVIDNPYLPFGHVGVRAETVKEGRILLWRTSRVEEISTQNQALNIPLDDFSDINSVLLDFETTIQYHVTDPVTLVRKFGATSWFNSNLRAQYLSIVREAVKKRDMAHLMTDPSTASEVDAEITNQIREYSKNIGLPIIIDNIALGRAKPNAEVLEQMNATAKKQQMRKTLIESTEAEKQRAAEQTAKAQADNAYRQAMNLSPEQFVELERIRRYSEVCAKSTCVVGLPNAVIQTR